MSEEDSIRFLKEHWAVEYHYASLKFFHRKYKGEQTLYITTKGCYKIESGYSITNHFPNMVRIKGDYGTLTYTYRNAE